MRSIGHIKTLYNKIYFNKRNIVLVTLCFVSIIIVAYSNLNLGFTDGEFQFLKDDYVNEYIKSSYNFCLIINSVIIPILFLAELKEEISAVNSILIPRVTRKKLQISKVIIMLEISFIISVVQIIIIGILPCLAYPGFKLKWNYLMIGIYLILYTFFSVLLLNVLLKYIKLFIIGAFPVLIYLLINIFKDNIDFVKYVLALDTIGQSLVSYNCLYFLLGFIILLIFLYSF